MSKQLKERDRLKRSLHFSPLTRSKVWMRLLLIMLILLVGLSAYLGR